MKLKVQILIDNPNSWIMPYSLKLVNRLIEDGHNAVLLTNPDEVQEGNVLCLLSCEKIFSSLHLNEYNLVVHESDLPKGKGWSPLTWQIIEGKNSIPITLFEAKERIDAGDIYNQKTIDLIGNELLPEIKDKQGIATIDLIIDFVAKYPNIIGRPQSGKSTYYPRRGEESSELDVNKSIAEQFELLRVCDNDRYPAFFKFRSNKYIIKIFKDD